MLERCTIDTFAPHLHERFVIRLDDGAPLECALVEIERARVASAVGTRREPFSLVLRGPRAPVLPQRTYVVAHDALGELALFLVPIGPDAEGMRYEAVFT